MARPNDTFWDTENRPQADGLTVDLVVDEFLSSTTKEQARGAIDAAPESLADEVATLQNRFQSAGGLIFDGVSGYGTLPDINLAGGQLGIFFVYHKRAAATGNTAGIITRARVGLSADGGWSILDRSGQAGEQQVAIALNDSRFTGADARPNWPLTLSDLPVGSVSTWGFNLDNSSDPADLDLEFFLNGASQGQRTVTGSDAYRDSPLARTHIATSTALSAFSALGISGLAIANRVITPTEHAEFAASGGQIVPLTLRGNLIAFLPCNDGVGTVCRDMSGAGNHMTLSPSGRTHLIPSDSGQVPARAVNATSAMYLLRSDDILLANVIVTGVIVDGAYQPVTAVQNMALMRVRLNPSGGDLQVQRSNGTTHETIATFTPASLASFNITIIYRIAL